MVYNGVAVELIYTELYSAAVARDILLLVRHAHLKITRD